MKPTRTPLGRTNSHTLLQIKQCLLSELDVSDWRILNIALVCIKSLTMHTEKNKNFHVVRKYVEVEGRVVYYRPQSVKHAG